MSQCCARSAGAAFCCEAEDSRGRGSDPCLLGRLSRANVRLDQFGMPEIVVGETQCAPRSSSLRELGDELATSRLYCLALLGSKKISSRGRKTGGLLILGMSGRTFVGLAH